MSNDLSNLAHDILAEAGDEAIEAITIGAKPFSYTDATPLNVPLSWETAFPYLNYEYLHCLGGDDVHPFVAWTATRMIFIVEYDGLKTICQAPRNPSPCKPTYGGTVPSHYPEAK
jgi:hypothetical protein